MYCNKHEKTELTLVKSDEKYNCYICTLCNEENNKKREEEGN